MVTKYEIFSISAKWNQKNYKKNGTQLIKAKHTDRIDIQKWWDDYNKTEIMQSKKPIELIELKLEFLGNYSWWVHWFSHITYNVFSNEQDAFNDFQRFLEEEVGTYIREGGVCDFDENLFYQNNQPMCLMGATEKWRWQFHECAKCDKCTIDGTVIEH
jgi:hypothetical protein